jgi:hypothetical protein
VVLECPKQAAKPSFSRARMQYRVHPLADSRGRQCDGFRKRERTSVGIEPSTQDRLVSNRLEMLPPLRCVLVIPLILPAILAGCGSRPAASERPLFGTGVFHPPPKPGASISQTRMCECKACEPSSCCDGPDDDTPAQACGEDYDFSRNKACGISVRSCTSRCTREVWRVNSAEPCAAKRPESCCQAG